MRIHSGDLPGPLPRADTFAGRLFLNGKFYGGAVNGVHRVADRLLQELDRLATSGGQPANWDMRLLLPERDNWAPRFTAIRAVPQRFGHTQLWEQAILPIAARSGALASFANLAPRLHRRKLTMVHDAQFRLSPESYPAKLRFGYRTLVPVGARSSQVVLTVSDYARDSLATFAIADPVRTHVIHNGADHILQLAADPSVIDAHALVRGSYCLVFGSSARYKNLQVVFAAFARGELSDVQLVVVGPTREALAKAGVVAPPQAVFVGSVGDAALRALYDGARCLLYPSRTEGFGLPPVEAMLCRCPVLAAPGGAIPEIGRDAICYAGMDDPADWAEQIRRLGERPELRAAKIAAGLERAEAFRWEAAGLKLSKLLTPLVERR
ncbi:glycosyltransferase family 4 protein [Sphingomonas sp. PL-96]|uniref:glycosyltransferase family 4 protein n=1 Tax=Sphingomonas sp. PL-96 TaxID=2887201 RepID=UPI001E4C06BB|nr:glycosyltransferase family 1 protein [Sphingomonas sp. PL-96]MCC2976611.1 glycosyltransferase family 4 protein [Sphingomonas sp. PL-96]